MEDAFCFWRFHICLDMETNYLYCNAICGDGKRLVIDDLQMNTMNLNFERIWDDSYLCLKTNKIRRMIFL